MSIWKRIKKEFEAGLLTKEDVAEMTTRVRDHMTLTKQQRARKRNRKRDKAAKASRKRNR